MLHSRTGPHAQPFLLGRSRRRPTVFDQRFWLTPPYEERREELCFSANLATHAALAVHAAVQLTVPSNENCFIWVTSTKKCGTLGPGKKTLCSAAPEALIRREVFLRL